MAFFKYLSPVIFLKPTWETFYHIIPLYYTKISISTPMVLDHINPKNELEYLDLPNFLLPNQDTHVTMLNHTFGILANIQILNTSTNFLF